MDFQGLTHQPLRMWRYGVSLSITEIGLAAAARALSSLAPASIERVRCNFHDRSEIAISGFAASGACKRKVRIGIRVCVGTVGCIPVGRTSKRSARQRTPGG